MLDAPDGGGYRSRMRPAPAVPEVADPDGAPWAARKITQIVFVAPDDTEVKVAERAAAWILDRTRFDAFLAERAVALGAELRVSTEAAGMTCERDGRWRVQLRG